MDKNKDIWIGIIALVVISASGVLWVVVSSQVPTTSSIDDQQSQTQSTSTSSDIAVQLPQVVDRSTQDVVSVIKHIPNAAEFSSLIATSGVTSLLQGAGPYTVFAPADGAFDELPRGSLSTLSPTALKRFVEYHLLANQMIDPASQYVGVGLSISGDAVNFTLGPGNLPMVNSAVIITEYQAKNGVVYLIDNVLVPPNTPRGQL